MRQDRPGLPKTARTDPVHHAQQLGRLAWVWGYRLGSGCRSTSGRSITLPFGSNGWTSVPVGTTPRSNILLVGLPAAMLDLRTAPRHDCAGLTEG